MSDGLKGPIVNALPKEGGGNVLLIGFSFGLRPDGSPGICNGVIAEEMVNDLRDLLAANPAGDHVKVAMQWEIRDAIDDIEGHAKADASLGPGTCIVVPPAELKKRDVLVPEALLPIVAALATPRGGRSDNALQAAVRLLPRLVFVDSVPKQGQTPEQPSDEREKLAKPLRDLLADRLLYRQFAGILDLPDLRRPEKLAVGLEKRVLPNQEDYTQSGGQLRTYQAQRVNRLILETIVPEHVLARGVYLNTEGVAKYVFDQLGEKEWAPAHVVVYAHPLHRVWCATNTGKICSRFAGTGAGMPRIWVRAPAPDWTKSQQWDPKSAQVWCRSEENYLFYNTWGV